MQCDARCCAAARYEERQNACHLHVYRSHSCPSPNRATPTIPRDVCKVHSLSQFVLNSRRYGKWGWRATVKHRRYRRSLSLFEIINVRDQSGWSDLHNKAESQGRKRKLWVYVLSGEFLNDKHMIYEKWVREGGEILTVNGVFLLLYWMVENVQMERQRGKNENNFWASKTFWRKTHKD